MIDGQTDIERRLHAYYASLTPPSSARAVADGRILLEDARRGRRPAVRALHRFDWAGAAAVVIALVVVLLPLLRPAAAPLATPNPTPTGSGAPTASVGGSTVVDAGTIGADGRGGFWAIRNRTLMVSTDGSVWRAAGILPDWEIPADAGYLPPLVMLDERHAWLVAPSRTTGSRPSADARTIAVSVYRTSDGGASWQEAPVPGRYPGYADLTFADPAHGFLGLARLDGGTDLFRSGDGGAGWTLAAARPRTTEALLGFDITATDAETVWSYGYEESPYDPSPLLAVSRDAGRTWQTAVLPGMPAVHTPGDRLSVISRRFYGMSDGLVALSDYRTIGRAALRIFRTSDGGRSWTAAGTREDPERVPRFAPYGPASWTAVLLRDVSVTSDGGATWRQFEGSGLPAENALGLVAFVDAYHGIGLVSSGLVSDHPMYVTSDGGRTWRPAAFGTTR